MDDPKPSIKTIARALGVTAAAVSKALNDKADIGPGLKARIRDEADRQGFIPSRAARQLATGRSRTLGIFLLNRFGRPVREYFGYHLLDGLLARAQTDDYDLVLLQDTDALGRPLGVNHARERGVAGVVIFGLDAASPEASSWAESGLPAVAVDTPAPGLPLVTSDQRTGVASLVGHLRAFGHGRIGYIGLRGDGWVARERRAGFRGVDGPTPGPEIEAPLNMEGGFEGATALVTRHPDLSALVCASDLQAYGALQALRRMGRTPPQHISLGGFDDLQASALMDPGLTTVAQDPAALGALAADSLLTLLAGRTVPELQLVPTRLIVRGSTGPWFPKKGES